MDMYFQAYMFNINYDYNSRHLLYNVTFSTKKVITDSHTNREN